MNIQRLSIYIFILTSLISKTLFSQDIDSTRIDTNQVPKSFQSEKEWVDSVFSSLSIDEKIGQLFMIRAHSNKTKAYHEKVAKDIRDNKVGGLCFFQGGPIRQIDLVNYYQSIARVPLFVSIDGEWGISMRLDSTEKYPRQLTLGAIQNNDLIVKMGKQVAQQCKIVGVNMNFAPVVDVNNNPLNPVINSRSFGENPKVVAEKSIAYMLGMQNDSVMAVAKHFPGHGDTDMDSHLTLPRIDADMNEIDSIHLPPFREIIENNVGGVMVAHLYIPAIDSTKNQASSISPNTVNGLLKENLGFKGLAITDALEMNGVKDYNKPGELEVKALLAGNDILLMPKNVSLSVTHIKKAIEDGTLKMDYIDAKVKNILAAKYHYGLTKFQKLDKEDVYNRINSPTDKALIKQLYRNAITLIKNDSSILPITTDSKIKVAVVTIGFQANNAFSKRVNDYRKADLFHLNARESMANVNTMVDKLKGYDLVIINISKTNNSAKRNYNIYQSSIGFANLLAQKTKIVIALHGNPYSLNRFTEGSNVSGLIVSYQDNDYAMEASAEALFGGSEINGKLPVTASKKYPSGFGLTLKKKRISFGSPEELGYSSDSLKKIDSIIQFGIDTGAYPGCQVMVVKDGMIIYKQSFGKPTYKSKDSISAQSIYDLASITKVMATTMAIMHLADAGKIDIDQRLDYYLPELDSTNKGDILIRDLLSHQARLKPWIPFYLHSMKDKKLNPAIYSTTKKEGYTIQVANDIYILDTYKDSIWKEIIESDLLKRKKYKYSDLGFYIMKEIIERQTNCPLDQYVDSVFYQPLGLQSFGYLPLDRFNPDLIVPTEYDQYFRKQLINGYVHDQGCAMIGGVQGHAGLFGNSLDMAILSQMLLQEGNYGGVKFLDQEEIEDFSRRQFPLNDNRRALGFDKALPDPSEGGPTCALVSSESYGHSGFTGTYFWIDPKYNLTYIFLSNRVYPSAENRLLINLDIRTRIQERIYQAIGVKE